jgi:hypothetical protein
VLCLVDSSNTVAVGSGLNDFGCSTAELGISQEKARTRAGIESSQAEFRRRGEKILFF